MTLTISLQARHLTTAVVAVGAVVLAVWWAAPALSQTAGPDPVDSYAVVARADNPVDALAASAVAGQLGAPVYLTFTATLDDQARQGLLDTSPDTVLLAGGLSALSQQVQDQIVALLPDATVRRVGGKGRTETARLLNELPGELGIVRPVLVGASVAGDVGIDGTLTLAGTDVAATLTAALDRLEAVEARTGSLETELAAANGRIGTLETEVDTLQATLGGVTRTSIDGRDTLRLDAMNLQIVNGTGTTSGTPNGEGNLIIGSNAPRSNSAVATDRAGSHSLIVGDEHHWTSFGGIVAGFRSTVSGDWASVTGGSKNTASGLHASVTGGESNTASGIGASVSGGGTNTASGDRSSVSGGQSSSASGSGASVSGGGVNTASGERASVSGGFNNTASGFLASVSGGQSNTASGGATTVAGGLSGEVSSSFDSLIGNTPFADG
ncbi:MAG TPA: cell wall-binding repeat-containing protein [Nitriliruptorales bacterium]